MTEPESTEPEEEKGVNDIYEDSDIANDVDMGDTVSRNKEMRVVEHLEDVIFDDEENNNEPEPEEEEVQEREAEPEPEPEHPDGEEGDEPEPPPLTEEAAPETFTVKVDGEEMHLGTDELISGYQKAASSDQRFRKASEMEQRAKGALEGFLQPEGALDGLVGLYADHYGGDFAKAQETVDEIVGGRVEQLMELEAMTEEERQIRQLTEEKGRMEEQMKQEAEVRDYNERQSRVQQQNQSAVPLLNEAINKFDLAIGSPEDNKASEILADYVRQGHAISQELADQVVSEVVNNRRQLLQDTVSGMSAEDLLSTNPELAKELREKSIEQIKEARATNQPEPPKSVAPAQRRRKPKTLSEDESSSNDFFNQTDW